MADQGTNSRAGMAVVILVVLALVAGGLWWWLKPAPVAQGVVFVGDSVTYMSIDDLKAEIGSKRPEVLARVGYTSTQLLPIFEQTVRERERSGKELKQVVVLVGYNDVLQDKVDSKALDPMMTLAQRFDCAIWLTIPPVPLRDQLTDQWNARVRDAAKTRKHVHVIDDWRKAVEDAPPGELITRKDGVHPTKAGAAKLTELMVRAIEKLC